MAFLSSFGSSMLYGYNLAVVNSPAQVCDASTVVTLKYFLWSSFSLLLILRLSQQLYHNPQLTEVMRLTLYFFFRVSENVKSDCASLSCGVMCIKFRGCYKPHHVIDDLKFSPIICSVKFQLSFCGDLMIQWFSLVLWLKCRGIPVWPWTGLLYSMWACESVLSFLCHEVFLWRVTWGKLNTLIFEEKMCHFLIFVVPLLFPTDFSMTFFQCIPLQF